MQQLCIEDLLKQPMYHRVHGLYIYGRLKMASHIEIYLGDIPGQCVSASMEHQRAAIEKAMSGELSGITDATHCVRLMMLTF